MRFLLLIALVSCISDPEDTRTDAEILEEIVLSGIVIESTGSDSGAVYSVVATDWDSRFLAIDSLRRFQLFHAEVFPDAILGLPGSPSLSFTSCTFDRFPLAVLNYEGNITWVHKVCAINEQQMAWIQANNKYFHDDSEVRFCLD